MNEVTTLPHAAVRQDLRVLQARGLLADPKFKAAILAEAFKMMQAMRAKQIAQPAPVDPAQAPS